MKVNQMKNNNKNNIEYWGARQAQIYTMGEKNIKDFHKDLIKAFEQARSEIDNVIKDFIFRYAVNNEITFAQAQKKLSKTELKSLKSFIKNALLNTDKVKTYNMSIKARMSRYEALMLQIDAVLDNLYSYNYEELGKEALKDIYTQSYNRTWYDFDLYRGFHAEFAQISIRDIEELIKYPFNGANFSDRIWKQKDHLLSTIKESITTNLVQGVNPYLLSDNVAAKFNTKKFEAARLLQTEAAFIIEQGTLAAYKEEGVTKYKILATLDMKTSEVCQEQDGKTYDIEEYVTGKTAPPFHPFCRSTTIPVVDDEEGKRIARDVEGNNIEVPSSMTYNQWYKEYII